MTDHATEAHKHIGWVHDWQEREGETDATNIAAALMSQTHALLAIHEQLATIARAMRVADVIRAQVATHHVTLRDDLDKLARPTASPDQEGDRA